MCPFSNLVIGAVLDNIYPFVQFLCVGDLCKSHLCLGKVVKSLTFNCFFANLGMTISTTWVAVQVMQVQRHII
jgi:hypothetical protein